MDLRHYSREGFDFEFDRVYDNSGDFHAWKPRGFWVTTTEEDGWLNWCQQEHFAPERLATESHVALSPSANLLHITSLDQFDAFWEQNQAPLYPGARPMRSNESGRQEGVDWTSTLRDYQGILITPYFWARRYDAMWYSGWDVSSGVIWDLQAILAVDTQVRKVSETELESRREHEETMKKLNSYWEKKRPEMSGTLGDWTTLP